MNADGYIDVLENNLIFSARKLKLGCHWIFQQDFSCQKCTKNFQNSRNLVRHDRRVHLGIKLNSYTNKPLPCDICGITVRGTMQLKFHKMGVHEHLKARGLLVHVQLKFVCFLRQLFVYIFEERTAVCLHLSRKTIVGLHF